MDLTAHQISILERLQQRGFQTVAFPLYAEYVGVRKGNCAALLVPAGPNGFTVFGEPAYLVGGSLSVRILRSDGHYFVRKGDQVEATPERVSELESFAAELAASLLPVA
ncbi:MAG: hypothetical protein LAN59_16640 [Acidobacteriia bacterium]|nr:hypothetical protein [Terriglobia bacterium]